MRNLFLSNEKEPKERFTIEQISSTHIVNHEKPTIVYSAAMALSKLNLPRKCYTVDDAAIFAPPFPFNEVRQPCL